MSNVLLRKTRQWKIWKTSKTFWTWSYTSQKFSWTWTRKRVSGKNVNYGHSEFFLDIIRKPLVSLWYKTLQAVFHQFLTPFLLHFLDGFCVVFEGIWIHQNMTLKRTKMTGGSCIVQELKYQVICDVKKCHWSYTTLVRPRSALLSWLIFHTCKILPRATFPRPWKTTSKSTWRFCFPKVR